MARTATTDLGELLDELEADSSAATSPNLLPASVLPPAKPSSGVRVDWGRLGTSLTVLGAIVVIGIVAVVVVPRVLSSAMTAADSASRPDDASTQSDRRSRQTFGESLLGTDNNAYRLPSDLIDHPTGSGIHIAPGAYGVERGTEFRLELAKFFRSSGSLQYALTESTLPNVSVNSKTAELRWAAPRDFPLGVYEYIVTGSDPKDGRPVESLKGKIQVIELLGPRPQPGERAPSAPIQSDVSGTAFKFRGFEIRPLAAYSIEAVVLSSKFYTSGKEAQVSPIDLALGWRRMSDESLIRKLDVNQSNRRYMTRVILPHNEDSHQLGNMAANVHIIPATRELAERLAAVNRGDLVVYRSSTFG